MEHIRIQLLNCVSAWETCNIIWKLEKDTQLKVIIFLWRWWSARNKANDGGRMLNADEIHNSVNYFQMEFEKLSVSEKKSIQATKDNWKPPPEDIYKVNIDGAFDPKTRT